MLLELTAEERDLIRTLVEQELEEIGPEIRHTQERDYREDLRERRRVIKQLGRKLGTAQEIAG